MNQKLRDLLEAANDLRSYALLLNVKEDVDGDDISHLDTLVGECVNALGGLESELDTEEESE